MCCGMSMCYRRERANIECILHSTTLPDTLHRQTGSATMSASAHRRCFIAVLSRGAFSHATCNSNKGGENGFYKLVKAKGAARPIICMSKFVNHYVKLLTASQVSEIL